VTVAPALDKPKRRTRAAVVVGDYFTDGTCLWMIRDLNDEGVFVEDCRTTDVHYRDFKWLADMTRVEMTPSA
jgi:hypothetical protein